MNRFFTIGFGLILGLGISLGLSMYFSLPKTGFVNTQEVFTGFGQTKDLHKKLSQVESRRAHLLDSLQMTLRLKYESIQQAGKPDKQQMIVLEKMQEDYLAREKYFEQDKERLANEYNEQIWKQLNQYIREFGEQNNYQYIYGANGEGNLMYARSSEDLTEELLQYVNERYQGDL